MSKVSQRLFALASAYLLLGSVAEGQLFDLFRNKNELKAEAHQEWFKAQQRNIKLSGAKIGISKFKYTDPLFPRALLEAEGIALIGKMENLTDKKIIALVLDIQIFNKENQREAAKGTRVIPVEVLKSQTLKLSKRLTTDTENLGVPARPRDDIFKAMKSLKYSWSYKLRTVLTEEFTVWDLKGVPTDSEIHFEFKEWHSFESLKEEEKRIR